MYGLRGIILKGLLEICCGSFEDVKTAWQNGADRVELNSALYLGQSDLRKRAVQHPYCNNGPPKRRRLLLFPG